jgi:hypothetical protein
MPNSTNATTVQQHLRELQTLVQDSLKHWSLATDSTAASALAANPGRLTNGNYNELDPGQLRVNQICPK